MLSFIDRQFKAYGTKAYGEETMDRLNDSEIEKARCYAFSVLGERTKKYGRQPKGTVESIFCQKVAGMLGIENQSLSE